MCWLSCRSVDDRHWPESQAGWLALTVTWYGVVWCAMVCYGVGMVWYGMVGCGVVWCGVM